MGATAIRLALAGACLGHEEPPRRRHNAPLSIAAARHEGHAHIQTFGSIWARLCAAVHNKLNATKHKLASVYRRALDEIEADAGSTRQQLAVLIFDELEYDAFTENRRWPSGKVKIARRMTAATPSQWEKFIPFAPCSARGFRAAPRRLS
jgi:hypothetical protein